MVQMDLEVYDPAMKPRFAPLWWVGTVLALGGLILAPLQLAAFCELLAATGAALGLLHLIGRHRIRRHPDLRWFAALTTAVAIAATATSIIWATPTAAAPLPAPTVSTSR